MKIKVFSSLLFVCLFSLSAAAQRHLGGTVIEIIDGRTIVVQDKPNSRLTVRLQGIEVPDDKQPLAAVVKEHLGKMLLGKNVRVQMNGLAIGKVTSDGTDASGQMIRDGAAWYDLPEKNSHTFADSDNYLALETAAKTERRGVWSIAGLKPSWEFRAEQQKALEEKRKLDEAVYQAKLEQESKKDNRPADWSRTGGLNKANEKVEMWADIPLVQTNSSRREPSESSYRTKDAPSEREVIAKDSYESLIKIARLGGRISEDYESALDTNKKIYNYGYLRESLDFIDDGVNKIRWNFKKPENLQYLKNIQNVVQDINRVLEIMKNSDRIFYQGELADLAVLYQTNPVDDVSGEKVIIRQVILSNMFGVIKNNFAHLQTNISRSELVK